MKLIDAPIGIFRFDGELVLKTEYCSENKLNGKYIPDCYIIRTGEYFWGDAKTANELNNLDVEPVDFAELLPTVTDTISRQAAIDTLTEYGNGRAVFISVGEAVIRIEQLPPAQLAKVATDINVGDKDIISRKAAIEEIERWLGYIDDDMVRRMQIGMKRLPPAQPERIKSKWALHTYMPHNKFCMACRNDSPYNKRWDFCPNCGADMREVTT